MPRLSDSPPKPANNAISGLPELILPPQLATALGVHRTTLWRWIKAGNGPKRIVIGATVFFQKEDVLTWLAAHKHQGA
jgi:predicted DNA-binding transcriptional regulator AlpA